MGKSRRVLSHRPASSPEALKASLERAGVYCLGRPSAVYLRWQHDVDYAQRLSPADKAWLSRFQDELYRSATFRPEFAIHDEDGQRENQRAFKANQRDALARSDGRTDALYYGNEPSGHTDAQPDGREQAYWGETEDELIDQLDLKRASGGPWET